MTVALSACKFCGSIPDSPRVEQVDAVGYVGHIDCSGCMVSVSTLYCRRTEAKAIASAAAAWNRTPEES